jgi:hypothetical protein
MNEALAVVGVFALVLMGGVLLRQWSRRQIAEIGVEEERDLAELADPSRWPAPPPTDSEGDDPSPDVAD